MMSVLALIQFIFSSCLLLYTVSFDDDYGTDIYHLFNDYIEKFDKNYKPGSEEYSRRETAFKESLKRVEVLNKRQTTAVYGINQFSDLTPEEFRSYFQYHGVRSEVVPSKSAENFTFQPPMTEEMKTLPQKVDWRKQKVVGPVRNQFKCGACWAFSIVETIETMYALKTGVLEQWSVQQIIDCAPKPNDGCDGGDTCLAIDWLYRKKIRLVLAEDYPFGEDSGLCKVKRSKKTVNIASNFTCDSFIGEEHLMLRQLANHGPLVVAVDAAQWQDYVAGTIQIHCTNERNHAVQIVGYDLTTQTRAYVILEKKKRFPHPGFEPGIIGFEPFPAEGDVPHYIVRNTWGEKFGNKGYLNIAFGNNTCSIAEEVSSLDVI